MSRRVATPTTYKLFSFTDLKNRGWKYLCSYTHSGLLQLDRRFWTQDDEPGYSEEELVEITTTTTTCTLLLVGRFLASQKLVKQSHAAEASGVHKAEFPAR